MFLFVPSIRLQRPAYTIQPDSTAPPFQARTESGCHWFFSCGRNNLQKFRCKSGVVSLFRCDRRHKGGFQNEVFRTKYSIQKLHRKLLQFHELLVHSEQMIRQSSVTSAPRTVGRAGHEGTRQNRTNQSREGREAAKQICKSLDGELPTPANAIRSVWLISVGRR